jgi:hypothetical protein
LPPFAPVAAVWPRSRDGAAIFPVPSFKSCLIHWFAFLALPVAAAEPFDPSGIVLTWQHDPATTMTVDWHSIDGLDLRLVEQRSPKHDLPAIVPVHAKVREPRLHFRQRGESAWRTALGVNAPFPFKEDRDGSLHRDGDSHSFPASSRTIHRVELTELKPDTGYELRFDPDGAVYRFRTMPSQLSREVRFAAGGDIGSGTWTETMNRVAASHDPDFALWGGDLAYCDGAQARLGRWYEFFASMKKSLITADRRLIPVLVTTGNHEVQGGYSDAVQKTAGRPYRRDDDALRRSVAPYFTRFFATPGQPGYKVVDFGDYLSILLLDSGHLNPVGGDQAAWLDATLAQRARVPHVFPAYHVPAFPTFRPLTERYVKAVQEHWVPLFERHNLAVVFENHDHNFKRTHPIRNMQRDPTGVTYLGDGAWGVFVVGVAREERWFLEKTMPISHCYLVRLNGPRASFTALNLKNEEIDRYEVAARRLK